MVDLMDLVSKDEEEGFEEDTSVKEDPSIIEEDPITEPELIRGTL